MSRLVAGGTPRPNATRTDVPSSGVRRAGAGIASAAGLLAFLAVGACANFDQLVDVAFPPAVPGLGGDRPWLDLPIGTWVTEGKINAAAIAACLPPRCGPGAAVGVFEAEGAEASLLSDVVAQPQRLAAQLARRAPRGKPPRRPRPPVSVAVAPLSVGGFRGVTIRLARRTGERAAFGAVLAVPRPGRLLAFVLVVAQNDEAARLASEVAAALR